MRYRSVLLLVFVLLISITPMYAAEPTEETACCMSFLTGSALDDACSQYEINQKRCDKLVSSYESLVFWTDGFGSLMMPVLALGALVFFLWVLWGAFKKLMKHKK